jgi:hypothetical protein
MLVPRGIVVRLITFGWVISSGFAPRKDNGAYSGINLARFGIRYSQYSSNGA